MDDAQLQLCQRHPVGSASRLPLLLLADRGAQCVAYRVEQVVDVLYVELDTTRIAKFGMTGTGAPSGTLRSSGCVTGHGGASERLPLGH